MSVHLNNEFFVSLIKRDSRKIEGFPLSNCTWTQAMLKSCIGVLASQTKLYRVKQRREAHKVISFNKRYVFLKWSSIYSERLPAAYRLSLIARCNSPVFGKPKHRCTSVVSVVILFISVETSTAISCFFLFVFLRSRRSTTTVAAVTMLRHFKR